MVLASSLKTSRSLSLSMPTMPSPLSAKTRAASPPIRPADPVITATATPYLLTLISPLRRVPGLPLEVTRGHDEVRRHQARRELANQRRQSRYGTRLRQKGLAPPKGDETLLDPVHLHKLACFYPQFCSGDPATLVRLRIPPYIDLTHSSHFLPRGSRNPPPKAANCLLCNCLFYRVWLRSHSVPPFKLGEVPHPRAIRRASGGIRTARISGVVHFWPAKRCGRLELICLGFASP